MNFSKFLHKSMIHKAEEINSSMQGNISRDQCSKMNFHLNNYDYINTCINQLDEAISLISNEFTDSIKIIETAPCITYNSVTGIISEIGVDMSVFPDAKHLCSWAGLTPQNNESAGKKRASASAVLAYI